MSSESPWSTSSSESETGEYDLLVYKFETYVADIYLQIGRGEIDSDQGHDKLTSVLRKLATAAVRQASTTLLPEDLELKLLSNGALSEKMRMHVRARGGAGLKNSAWSMMEEAAIRLGPAVEIVDGR